MSRFILEHPFIFYFIVSEICYAIVRVTSIITDYMKWKKQNKANISIGE